MAVLVSWNEGPKLNSTKKGIAHGDIDLHQLHAWRLQQDWSDVLGNKTKAVTDTMFTHVLIPVPSGYLHKAK